MTDQTSPEAGNPAMLAATREPVSTMVVVCEVSAMESGDEGNSSGTGGTETGGADTGVGVAGATGGVSSVSDDIAVTRQCADGASGGSGQWQGCRVRAAVVVSRRDGSCLSRLFPDLFEPEPTALVDVSFVEHRPCGGGVGFYPPAPSPWVVRKAKDHFTAGGEQ